MQSRLDKSRYLLNAAHDGSLTGTPMSWQEIADKIGLTKGTVYRVAVFGYEPKDEKIRRILELDERKRHHNEYKDLFSTPVETLRFDVKNREEL